jgi:hypothetical protein
VLANGDFNNAAFASKPKLNRGKATKAKKQAFFSDSEEDLFERDELRAAKLGRPKQSKQ